MRHSQTTGTSRSAGKPVRSLVDRKWQSGSKITLDLPWRPARAGRQEERESKGRGERRREKRQGREVEGEDQAGPATMTSRASNGEEQKGVKGGGEG